MLAGVWLLWPDPGHRAPDQGGRAAADRPATDAPSDGLVTAAQASVDISAKRQLAGEVGVVQYRLMQRLRQVAKTMPEIDLPDESSVEAAIEGSAPAADLQPARTDPAVDDGAAPAVRSEPAELAAPAPLPAPAASHPPPRAVARPAPAAEPTPAEHARNQPSGDDKASGEDGPSGETAIVQLPTPAVTEHRAAAVVDPLPKITPDPATITPEAAPATPEARGADGQSVALLDVSPDVLALKTGHRRTPTWLRNAVQSAPDARPAVAVVIDDLGLNRRGTAALNGLRAPLTLAFLPYATDLENQTQAARAAGHELLVHVPMEPRSQDWPGPNALTSQLGPAELVSRLRSQLRSFRGFVGVNNHMGSLLTADPERMAILMAELRQRDLLFLDSRTTPKSVAAREAERMRVPFAERDVFIDNELELNAVLRELAHAESIARRQGHAVAMGHPHDVTIEALKHWLPTLEARGIALVPISAIVARQSCASGLILVANACARYAVAHGAVP